MPFELISGREMKAKYARYAMDIPSIRKRRGIKEVRGELESDGKIFLSCLLEDRKKTRGWKRMECWGEALIHVKNLCDGL